MFGHLDLNSDGLLSTQEMYDLEHDQVIFLNSAVQKLCDAKFEIFKPL